MIKLVIKYFLPILIFLQIAFAQDNGTPNGNSTSFKGYNSSSDNELRLMSNSDRFSHTNYESANQLFIPDIYSKYNEMLIYNRSNLKYDYSNGNLNEANRIFVINPISTKPANKKINRSGFNIVSSYRENIHFAGFYERYAILNFTPTLNIQPFDFININANQIYSCFIPISGVKEHFKTLFIQGAAVLAVDNSVKLIFGKDKIKV